MKDMEEKTKKYSVSFGSSSKKKRSERRAFFELAKKHAVKRTAHGSKTVSVDIDNILYSL